MEKSSQTNNITVVIDVFRAFSTASYILKHNPSIYVLTNKSRIIARLAKQFNNSVLIGKPEIGETVKYDIPNSPTRAQEIEIANRPILHRTEAGATGILNALKQQHINIVLAAGFVNAHATATYIRNSNFTIMPMGHEATTPSLEDDACANYIDALTKNKKMELNPLIPIIRKKSGKYFFGNDQWQYPQEDFEFCLSTRKFNFIIKAELVEDYAVLKRLDINHAL